MDLGALENKIITNFKRLDLTLRNENRFFLPDELRMMVENYVQFNADENRIDIRVGEIYYRARINGIGQENPYGLDKMKAPPLGEARAGRLNPDGISYLYLAGDIDTAIAEVRPHSGAKVSVAKLEINKDIKIVSLQKGTEHNRCGEFMEGGKVDWSSKCISDIYFSTPAHSADRFAYLPSQYIAEMFKIKGFDGIQFRSTQTKNGINLALFNQACADCKDISQYEIQQVDYIKK